MIDNAEKARWGTGESFSNQVIFLAVLFFTLVSMGLYRSPAVALMPDVTPNHLRSRANAVINLMGAVGGVYALIMIKFWWEKVRHRTICPCSQVLRQSWRSLWESL